MRGEAARRAIEIMVAQTKKPASRWRAVAQLYTMRIVGQPHAPKYQAKPGSKIEPEVFHDFADPKTGVFGQCLMRADGTWVHEPRGEEPVILTYLTEAP